MAAGGARFTIFLYLCTTSPAPGSEGEKGAKRQQQGAREKLGRLKMKTKAEEMSSKKWAQVLTQTVDRLSERESLEGLCHNHRLECPMPSADALQEIVDLARAILFPGYYGNSSVNPQTMRYHIGVAVERLHQVLARQVLAGLCFGLPDEGAEGHQAADMAALARQAEETATRLIGRLPDIRRTLGTDVEAAYNGDPAADSFAEIISCYPVIKALTNYRIAHELHLLGVPLIPRMMTEMAHSETGIDIHPAASIGHHFTIDHGTGVVIGATCVIGNNVKLYQGVTLGAKSFPLDQDGNPIKGIPRHPLLEDDVVVYSNATILGRITIGRGSIVGANVWVTRDMKPKTKKYKQEKNSFIDFEFNHGTGI